MKIRKELFDELQGLEKAMINEHGKEMLNPMPIEIPSSLKKPPSLQDRIAALVKGQLSQQAAQQEYETLDEANTFDLADDLVIELSGYELAEEEIPVAPEDPAPAPEKKAESGPVAPAAQEPETWVPEEPVTDTTK